MIAEIGPSSRLAPTLCAKLAPKLIGQVSDPTASPDTLCAALDALADLFARFEVHFRSNGVIQSQALAALVPLLSSNRPAVSKRAVGALGSLCASGGEEVFTQLVERTILPSLRSPSGVLAKSAVSLVGVLAKTAPARLGKTAPEFTSVIVPSARSADEELRELALQTLEQIVLKCPAESAPSAAAIVDSGLAGLKYDPVG